MRIQYDNYFYYNKFIYLLFQKNVITLLVYNTRRGKMTHSHEKIGGCSRSSCPFTCLMADRATSQIKVVNSIRKPVSKRQGIIEAIFHPLVPSSAKHIATPIFVTAKIKWEADLVLRICVFDIILFSKQSTFSKLATKVQEQGLVKTVQLHRSGVLTVNGTLMQI